MQKSRPYIPAYGTVFRTNVSSVSLKYRELETRVQLPTLVPFFTQDMEDIESTIRKEILDFLTLHCRSYFIMKAFSKQVVDRIFEGLIINGTIQSRDQVPLANLANHFNPSLNQLDTVVTAFEKMFDQIESGANGLDIRGDLFSPSYLIRSFLVETTLGQFRYLRVFPKYVDKNTSLEIALDAIHEKIAKEIRTFRVNAMSHLTEPHTRIELAKTADIIDEYFSDSANTITVKADSEVDSTSALGADIVSLELNNTFKAIMECDVLFLFNAILKQAKGIA